MDGLDDAKLTELITTGLSALGDYQDDCILIGGLVPFCYRWLKGYEDVGLSPCSTMGVDFAVEDRIAIRGTSTIRQQLENHGFTTHEAPGFGRLAGKQTFSLEAETGKRGSRYVEFIAPLRGPDRDEPARPQHDLTAECARFIDLLRARPCTITIPNVGPLSVPHPACYVIQKARIRPYRIKLDKHIKDQADLFLVTWALSDDWDEWRTTLADLSHERPEWGKWITDALKSLMELYLDDHGAGAIEVLRVFADVNTQLDVYAIRLIMKKALIAIDPHIQDSK